MPQPDISQMPQSFARKEQTINDEEREVESACQFWNGIAGNLCLRRLAITLLCIVILMQAAYADPPARIETAERVQHRIGLMILTL
jgi:hypothetical protein